MEHIIELSLKKYPPKGMNDSQDWQHDENAELRKAYIQGAQDMLIQIMRMLNPNFDSIANEINRTIVKNQIDIISAITSNNTRLTTKKDENESK